MGSEFDNVAIEYDLEFTFSEVGKLQRNQVWKYIDKTFSLEGKKVLEVNCGTGEDAIKLAMRGASVIASDRSHEMLRMARAKAQKKGINSIEFIALDLNELDTLNLGKFDLIFSNFGGLNCLSIYELKNVFNTIESLLLNSGRFVSVIMPKYCLWEMSYLLLKGDSTIFRRLSKDGLEVPVGNSFVKTWYHSTRNIENLLDGKLELINKMPIGFFLPPSYLNNFFKKRLSFLDILYKAEGTIDHWNFLSDYSDHFLIDVELKEE